MAWTESHTVLIRHRKLVELAASLRIRPAHAMGHLHALWHAALEQQEDGDLSAWSDEFIAQASDFPGNAPQYVRLLQKHRWLDGKLIHDWLDYAGRYLDAKYKTSNPKRLAEIRAKHSREAIDRLKSDYSQTTVGPPNSTVPNLTVPNQREGPDGPLARVKFQKPTLEELYLYAAKIGLPNDEVVKFFNYYESNGWKVGRNPMRSWQHALVNWKLRMDERRQSHGSNNRNEHIAAPIDPGGLTKAERVLAARKAQAEAKAEAQTAGT